MKSLLQLAARTAVAASMAFAPLVCLAVNAPPGSPAGESKAPCDGKSDCPEPFAPEEGCDCANGDCKPPDGVEPNAPKCIHEQFELALAPNEPGLGMGIVKLYIAQTNSNLASRQFIDFFGLPQMAITQVTPQSGGVELNIMQAGGTSLDFRMPDVKAAGDDQVVGYPIGESGYSLARLTYVDAAGHFVERNAAQAIRQYRAGGGYVEYPLGGGHATKYVTRQGRAYALPLAQVEVIRQYANGALVVNGNYNQGVLRQVKTAAGLIDVVPLNDRSYEVRKYAPQQVGAKAGGLYTVTSAPYFTMKVEAPAGTQNVLVVTKTEGGASTETRHTVSMSANGTSEEWKQEIHAGGFISKRVHTKTPVEGLGASYRQLQWDSQVENAPAGLISGDGGKPSYRYGLKTYKGAMVESSQGYGNTGGDGGSIGFGKLQKRSRTNATGISDSNSVGRPTDQTTSRGTKFLYGYDGRSGRMTSREAVTSRPAIAGGSSIPRKVEKADYTSHAAGDKVDFADFRPRTIETKVGDAVVGRSFFVCEPFGGTQGYKEISEQSTSASASYGDAGNLRAVSEWYGPGTIQGRLKEVRSAEGSIARFEYNSLPADGLEVIQYGKLDAAGNPVVAVSSRVKQQLDARGLPVVTTQAVWNGSAWVDYAKTFQSYNLAGRMTLIEREDVVSGQRRTLAQYEWDGPRLMRQVDASGIAYAYTYFDGTTIQQAIRREAVPALGDYPAQPEITWTYSGSFTTGANQMPIWQSRTTTMTAGDITLTSSETFDGLGRVVSSTDVNGFTTTIAYTEDDKVLTVTAPNGSTRTKTFDSDGLLVSEQGADIPGSFYHYEALAQGGLRATVFTGADNGPLYRTAETDGAGRLLQASRSGFSGNTIQASFGYSSIYPTTLTTTTQTGEPVWIGEPISSGNYSRAGKTADNGTLEPASQSDQLADTQRTIEQDSAGLWLVVRNFIYPEAGSAQSKQVSASRTQIAGFTGSLVSRVQHIDIAGNVTTSSGILNGKISEARITRPDIQGEDVTVAYAGRSMTHSTPGIEGLETWTYDAMGRPVSHKAPRHTQASATAYYPNTNLVASQTDATGNTTSYAYYPQGTAGAGRIKSVTLPDQSVQYRGYTASGELMVEWGSQTYPKWYEYDSYHRIAKLHTWKAAPPLDVNALPNAPPAGSQQTSWNYDASSGLLISKRYEDGKGPDFTYTAEGRPFVRQLARNIPSGASRISATYAYDSFGRVSSIQYNDGVTPGVIQTYDRISRKVAQSNGVAASTYQYSAATLQLEKETIGYDLNQDGTFELERTLQRTTDNLLRATGFTLGVQGSNPDAQAAYAYSPTDGRLSSISNPQLSNHSFTYDYVQGSSLIAKVTGPVHTVTNKWEPNRDVLVSKENKVGSNPISRFGYETNEIYQRTNLEKSGAGFNNVTTTTAWSYDSLGQLTQADDSANLADRAYQFDAIGNRQKSTAGTLDLNAANATTYAANALNQYTAISQQATIVNPLFDDDGNQTVGQVLPRQSANLKSCSYTWDAENRLIDTTIDGVTTHYAYDASGRRIAKVSTLNNQPSTTAYLYDGWNVVAEYALQNSSFTLHTSYLWGLDLSGSTQGAGGTGGLLSVTDHGATASAHYFPCFDGNGNVSEYLDATGSAAAHFEYDPSGQTIVDTDANGKFDIRFSTRKQDAETGLYYYGYRYFDPLTGRWLSREPLGEGESANLYGFCGNDPVNGVDHLGLEEVKVYDFGKEGEIVTFEKDPEKYKAPLVRFKDGQEVVYVRHYKANRCLMRVFGIKGELVSEGDESADYWGLGSGKAPPPPPRNFTTSNDPQAAADAWVAFCQTPLAKGTVVLSQASVELSMEILTAGVFSKIKIASRLMHAEEACQDAKRLERVAEEVVDEVASKTDDLMQSGGQLGGRLFPEERIRALVNYLEKHGIYLYEGVNGSFDGIKKVMRLPRNPTMLNVKHELCHFLDWKKYGDDYYKLFTPRQREQMVLDRLRKNRIWDMLNELEKNWSLGYPATR